MLLEDYFNFLAPDDIRLKGTRIGIETILFDHIAKMILKASKLLEIYSRLQAYVWMQASMYLFPKAQQPDC